MLWTFLLGLLSAIIGMMVALRHKNKKITIVLAVFTGRLVIGMFILLPGLLFVLSNWEF